MCQTALHQYSFVPDSTNYFHIGEKESYIGDQQNEYRPKKTKHAPFFIYHSFEKAYTYENERSHSVSDVSALPLIFYVHGLQTSRSITYENDNMVRTKKKIQNFTTNLFIRSTRHNTNYNTAQGVFAKKSGVNHSKTAIICKEHQTDQTRIQTVFAEHKLNFTNFVLPGVVSHSNPHG